MSTSTTTCGGHGSWVDKAQDLVSKDRVVDILCSMVDVPSPTGEEGPLARTICAMLDEAGLEATEQALDGQQSNAVGRLSGDGTRPPMLLYSPIDTVTSNDEAEDLPWVGDTLRADMQANSWTDGTHVFGLGAQNPKGHAACVLAAGEAIRKSGAPLVADLYLGFGAGGMPTNARTGARKDSGHGVGCQHMLDNLPKIGSAVIAKSGWSVSWEEVGLAWITVRVHGTHTYVGSRHLLPFSNAINDAGRLIAKLEVWFEEWAERHRGGLVSPQGVVSTIRAGWDRMPAFTPAECQFQLDLRVSPRTSIKQLENEFGTAFSQFCDELDISASWERTVFIPGTTTDPAEDIIVRCIDVWESIEGAAHNPVLGMSGATDANILRGASIPTARVGLTKAAIPDIDFQLGMNAAVVDDLERLTLFLVQVAVGYCADADKGRAHG